MKPQKLWLAPLLFATLVSGAVIADDDDDEHEGRVQRAAPVSNAIWKAECGSCHTLYHPGLLSAQSWHKVMSGLDKHFGTNASLDAASTKEIRDFLSKYSADSRPRRYERAAAAEAPLRITETTRFKREHREIAAAVWKRPKIGSPSNCAACHPGAEQGNFSERQVRIPR